jgi:hypothetical protein
MLDFMHENQRLKKALFAHNQVVINFSLKNGRISDLFSVDDF